ncbi:YesL family protein [Neobacillus sp. YX16]|uniref:YesL family protein n=1 Tax=Neobacillus sp. YX16 TaxID=3047874 RepID=UPI0024C21A28|nr:YesL family protein [Neobacillus sp. YX16]WHZ02159.1 YesL family protein [Neobacillus sp. YX16]
MRKHGENMKQLFKVLEFVTAFFQLNILWLLFCLPVITIFPASVAMFCVIRQWILHKDYSVFRSFFQYFKENFKQSFILGIIWIVFAGVFYLDFMLMKNLGTFQYILLPVLSLIGIVILFITIFIFSTIANYNVNWLTAIKNSLFFSVRYFFVTLSVIVLFVLMVLILYTWSVTFLFIFCVFAYCNYYLCHLVFNKIQLVQSSK